MTTPIMPIGIGLGALALGAIAVRGLRDDLSGGLPVDGFDAQLVSGEVPDGLNSGSLHVVERHDDGSITAEFDWAYTDNYEDPGTWYRGARVHIADWQGVASDDEFHLRIAGAPVRNRVPVEISRIERLRPEVADEGSRPSTLLSVGALVGLGALALTAPMFTKQTAWSLGVIGTGAIAGGVLGATLLSR